MHMHLSNDVAGELSDTSRYRLFGQLSRRYPQTLLVSDPITAGLRYRSSA